MTCIVAVPDIRRKTLIFGGDSAVTEDSGSLFITATPKVWRAGGYLLGSAGGGEWFTLMKAVEWPAVPSLGYPLNGLARDIRDAAKRLGLDGDDGWTILGAVIDDVPCLWSLDAGLMVDAIPPNTFAAIGSGAAPALGALYERKGSAEKRVELALRAAEAFRSDVRGPFTILRY